MRVKPYTTLAGNSRKDLLAGQYIYIVISHKAVHRCTSESEVQIDNCARWQAKSIEDFHRLPCVVHARLGHKPDGSLSKRFPRDLTVDTRQQSQLRLAFCENHFIGE